jgi:hypothetical protein
MRFLSLYFNGMNLQNDRLLKCGWMLHGRKVQSHQLCAQHILSLTMKMEILENKHQKRYVTYTLSTHTQVFMQNYLSFTSLFCAFKALMKNPYLTYVGLQSSDA